MVFVELVKQSTSDITLTHLFRQVLRSSHRQRQNRHSRVLPPCAYETGAIDNEQIFDVMALTPFVEHAGLRIISHPESSTFVNAISQRIRLIVLRQNFETRGLRHLNASIYR